MQIQVLLANDAATEFLKGFNAYKRLASARRIPASVSAAIAFRSLYVAIEKAIKSSLFDVNPYLLVDKIDPKLVLALTKDLSASGGQSILLSRQPFETPTLLRSWDLFRQVHGDALPADRVDAFEAALRRFADVRHRCQHSELVADRADLLSLIEQVLQGVRPIIMPAAPRFREECIKRNAQIEPRLQAIETRIDANWSVLIEYLKENGPISATQTLTLMHTNPTDPIDCVFQDVADDRFSLRMMIFTKSMKAEGLFSHFLSPDEEGTRRLERQLAVQGIAGESGTNRVTSDDTADFVALEAGSLVLKPESGWMTIKLPRIRPPNLSLSTFMVGFKLDVEPNSRPAGNFFGVLIGRSEEQAEMPAVHLSGTAAFVEEYALGPGAVEGKYEHGVTMRTFKLYVTMTPTTFDLARLRSRLRPPPADPGA